MQGNAGAELKIGDYYYYGLGTSVNYRKASHARDLLYYVLVTRESLYLERIHV
jgi:hypothetical protein